METNKTVMKITKSRLALTAARDAYQQERGVAVTLDIPQGDAEWKRRVMPAPVAEMAANVAASVAECVTCEATEVIETFNVEVSDDAFMTLAAGIEAAVEQWYASTYSEVK